MNRTAASTEAPARSARERIMGAAMQAFTELGYGATSTLEIATRAQVSKREMYALFGNKQAMLAACIAERAQLMRLPPQVPPIRDLDTFAEVLAKFGAIVLQQVCEPIVVGVFRLAIAEAPRAPEVAQTLEAAREGVRNGARALVVQAQSARLIQPDDSIELAAQYLALLWGDLLMGLLLRIRETPTTREIARRARRAAADFILLQSLGSAHA